MMNGTHQTQLGDERGRGEAEDEEEGQLSRSIHHVHLLDATTFCCL